MPIGPAGGAPATQQRMVDRLIADMKRVSAPASWDDALIFSNRFEGHIVHLDIFRGVREGNLQLDASRLVCVKRKRRT